MSNEEICRRCLVSGRVQGVFFRASTQRQARALGVRGRATNLPDGRVEVIACGEREDVEQLIDWLWEGPQMARVDSVETEELAPESLDLPERFGTG